MKKKKGLALILAFVLVLGMLPAVFAEEIDADAAIVNVHTVGFVGGFGPQISHIIVEYNVDMTDAVIDDNTYEVTLPTTAEIRNNGTGAVGDIESVKVATGADNVTGYGTSSIPSYYVIIELYTDYEWNLTQFAESHSTYMRAGITQVEDIEVGSDTIKASLTLHANYQGTSVAAWEDYTILDIDRFEYYWTSNANGTTSTAAQLALQTDGAAFTATNCWDEQLGMFRTIEQPYALYVPEDYDPSGSYAMVTIHHPHDSANNHPLVELFRSRSGAYFASEEAQQLVKDMYGLDGIIVVVPTMTGRVMDNASTPAGFPALLQLWDYLIEEYSIDEDHIYGVGQSVGGMLLMETNTKRDNFFAGIIMYENQWAQNYYKDTIFGRGLRALTGNGTGNNVVYRHYPSTDETVWNFHWDDNGDKDYENHDPYNMYYLTSDDNVLIINGENNGLSMCTWLEEFYLFKDLTGYEIPRLSTATNALMNIGSNVTTVTNSAKAEQQALIAEFLDGTNQPDGWDMGFNWISFGGQGGGNSSVGPWARSFDEPYEWLLSQTRTSTMTRSKLDLNKPFEEAEVQEIRPVRATDSSNSYTSPDGSTDVINYKTGAFGSGTQFYNTCWLNMSPGTADQIPGWLPEGMSHPVSAAKIVSVTPILTNGVLSAVAIKYNQDMTGALVNMKGDEITDRPTNAASFVTRADETTTADGNGLFVMVEPYEFYDANGSLITAEQTNYYINNAPLTKKNVGTGDGSGSYIIVELDTSSRASTVEVYQRTTVITEASIASPTLNGTKGSILTPNYIDLSTGITTAPSNNTGAATNTTITGSTLPFTDVNYSSWYYDAVKYAYENSIMNGVSSTEFDPSANINRAMMIQILFNIDGGKASGSASFSDVAADAWYAEAVAWASENEIVLGVGDGKFAPLQEISREQMAVMLYRYCQYKGIMLPVTRTSGSFTDSALISDYAKEAVDAMYKAGILNGKGNGVFDPMGTATRAEAAQMLKTFMEVTK